MTPTRLRRLAAAAASAAVLLAGFAPAASAAAAGPVSAGVRAGLGHPDPPHQHAWWYDALRLADAHRITTGHGATVAVVGDDSFALGVPELRGADVHLEQNCYRVQAHSKPADVVSDHGTRMAAFIAGTGRGPGPDGLGMLGVAPGARVELWPTEGPCMPSRMRQMVLQAAQHGADVISVSVGIDAAWDKTIRKINALGAVLVAACGNRSQTGADLGLPARARGVVAVCAVDKHARAWKGNPYVTAQELRRGSGYPVITAPGVRDEVSGWYRGYGWDHGYTTGTSDSTPMVAGMLALVKSRYPKATANQLIQQLIHYTGGGARYAWDSDYGFGIASVTEMLKHDPTRWPDENPLWLTPAEAIKTYPMNVRGQQHVLETPSPSAGAAARSGAAAQTRDAAAPAATSVPAGAWVAVGAALLALVAGGAVLAGRRRGPDAAAPVASTNESDHHKQGV